MKVVLHFKSPDVVYNGLLVEDDGDVREVGNNLTEEQEEIVHKYIQYGEYATISIDLETGEAKVMPRA